MRPSVVIGRTTGSRPPRSRRRQDRCFYRTPFEKAGALLESICNNHPFIDGNKRTALIAAAYLLHKFDIDITIPTVAGEEFMLLVAQHSPGVPAIAQQLERWMNQTA